MGAELGVLSGYQLYDASIQQDSARPFSLQSAIKNDNQPASVFTHEDDVSNNRTFAQNEVTLLRRLRHPNILKYLASTPVDSTGPLHLVTEFILPLATVEPNLHTMEIGVGLRGILLALQFLHENCQLSHNNVCQASVMVAGSDRTWRLGGFALASGFMATSALYLKSIADMRDSDSVPPEDRNPTNSTADCCHARDAWGLGCLVLSFADRISTYAELEASLSETLLHPDPECRPRMKEQLSNSIFTNQLVKVVQFVTDITLKGAKEKSAFFRGLPKRLQQIPAGLVAQYLSVRLLSRFVLLEESARRYMLPCLLVPQSAGDASSGLFNETMYKQHIVPVLLKLFDVDDKHIRMVLLEYATHYLPLMDRKTVEDKVLPDVLAGLQGSDGDDLVAATFHTLGDIVSAVGAEAVVGCYPPSRFSTVSPRPDGPSKFRESMHRPVSSSGSHTPSASTMPPTTDVRHSRAERPSCIRPEAKMSRSGQRGQKQSPKSPKRVTFSPENDFPTTEEALRQSLTWSSTRSDTGQQRVNGIDPGMPDEVHSAHRHSRLPSTSSEEYIQQQSGVRGGDAMASSPQSRDRAGVRNDIIADDADADFDDDEEPWPEFDDVSGSGDIGRPVESGGSWRSGDHLDSTTTANGSAVLSGSMVGGADNTAAGHRVPAASTTTTTATDMDGWGSMDEDDDGNDDDDDDDGWGNLDSPSGASASPSAESSPIKVAASEPVVAGDWSSNSLAMASKKDDHNRSWTSTSSLQSPMSANAKKQAAPLAPSPDGTQVEPKPMATTGLLLQSKSSAAAAAKKDAAKSKPSPPPPPVSEEDALLAMLEPDIKFSGDSSLLAPGTSNAKSPASARSPQSASKTSPSLSPSMLSSSKVSPAVGAAAAPASPPAPVVSTINFDYNPEDSLADADAGEGWGDDDFEDF